MSSVDPKTLAKWWSLITLLDSLTERKKLKWDNGTRHNSFITSVGKQIIEIGHVKHDDLGLMIEVFINDEFGETIDKFTDEDLPRNGELTAYPLMLNLYRVIARQVSGADEVLDSILSQLQEKDDDPF